jgi:hypothetical protein
VCRVRLSDAVPATTAAVTAIVSDAADRRNAGFPRNARSGRRPPWVFRPMRRCPCAARTVFSGSARAAREPHE